MAFSHVFWGKPGETHGPMAPWPWHHPWRGGFRRSELLGRRLGSHGNLQGGPLRRLVAVSSYGVTMDWIVLMGKP